MSKKPIRNSAKAIIIKDNKILVTQNRDLLGDYYLLPGGGQNHKETLDQAVIRECAEEAGASVTVGALLYIREYIAENHDFGEFDPDIHQVEFIFRCYLNGNLDKKLQTEPDATQIGIKWVNLTDLVNMRFYPSTLAKILHNFDANNSTPTYLGEVL